MAFYVVADADTVVGFRYAGVPGKMVTNASEAAAELDRLVAEGTRAIVTVPTSLPRTA